METQNEIQEQPRVKRHYKKRQPKILDDNNRIAIRKDTITKISPSMLDAMTDLAEEEIIRLKKEQSQFQDDLELAQMELDKAKTMYDEISDKYYGFEKRIVEMRGIIALQNSIKEGKPIEQAQVYDRISNNNGVKVRKPYPKDRAESISWITLAEDLLRFKDHFMKPLDIMPVILRDEKIRAQFEKQSKHDASKIHQLGLNFLKTASAPMSKKRKSKLAAFGDKIGLLEWFENGTIKPKYAVGFMG